MLTSGLRHAGKGAVRLTKPNAKSRKRAGGLARASRRVKHRARNRGSKRTGTLGICVQACVVVRCASAMCARRASSLSRHGRDGKRKAGENEANLVISRKFHELRVHGLIGVVRASRHRGRRVVVEKTEREKPKVVSLACARKPPVGRRAAADRARRRDGYQRAKPSAGDQGVHHQDVERGRRRHEMSRAR